MWQKYRGFPYSAALSGELTALKAINDNTSSSAYLTTPNLLILFFTHLTSIRNVYIDIKVYIVNEHWPDTPEMITWTSALKKYVLHVYTMDTSSILFSNNTTI